MGTGIPAPYGDGTIAAAKLDAFLLIMWMEMLCFLPSTSMPNAFGSTSCASIGGSTSSSKWERNMSSRSALAGMRMRVPNMRVVCASVNRRTVDMSASKWDGAPGLCW